MEQREKEEETQQQEEGEEREEERELHVSPASVAASLPRQPSSPENNDEETTERRRRGKNTNKKNNITCRGSKGAEHLLRHGLKEPASPWETRRRSRGKLQLQRQEMEATPLRMRDGKRGEEEET